MMTQTQRIKLPEMMDNVVMSARMEGFEISDSMQEMYLAILEGQRTIADCLAQINAKYPED